LTIRPDTEAVFDPDTYVRLIVICQYAVARVVALSRAARLRPSG